MDMLMLISAVTPICKETFTSIERCKRHILRIYHDQRNSVRNVGLRRCYTLIPAKITGLLRMLMMLGCFPSTSVSQCYPLDEGGQVCYIQPRPSVNLSWWDAQQVCKENGFTLPMPDSSGHNTRFQNAVEYFGLKGQTLWLGANSTFDVNTWLWVNGSRFEGSIVGSGSLSRPYAYVKRNGTDVKIFASNALILTNYICQNLFYDEGNCAGQVGSLWTEGRCYLKSTGQYTWYQARFYCSAGGDLAVFDDPSDFSTWLDDSQFFWIGLQSSWWKWQDAVSGTSHDSPYNLFDTLYPGENYPQCLAYYTSRGQLTAWKSLNCSSTSPQFICQRYNQTTTTTTTTSTTTTSTTTTTVAPVTTAAQTTGSSNTNTAASTVVNQSSSSSGENIPSSDQIETSNNLPLALGVGIGGGVFVVAVVVSLILIGVYIAKLRRKPRNPMVRNVTPEFEDDGVYSVIEDDFYDVIDEEQQANPYHHLEIRDTSTSEVTSGPYDHLQSPAAEDSQAPPTDAFAEAERNDTNATEINGLFGVGPSEPTLDTLSGSEQRDVYATEIPVNGFMELGPANLL